jgi:hypothetical protein
VDPTTEEEKVPVFEGDEQVVNEEEKKSEIS